MFYKKRICEDDFNKFLDAYADSNAIQIKKRINFEAGMELRDMMIHDVSLGCIATAI